MRALYPALALLALLSCGNKDSEVIKRERAFTEMLANSVLVGKFAMGDRVAEDRYRIQKVSKLAGETWIIQARIQYGKRDVSIPVPVAVKWAGDTPVITLTDVGLPGLGTYTARVLFYRGQYAGTWSAKDHGGQMWGKIEKQSASSQ